MHWLVMLSLVLSFSVSANQSLVIFPKVESNVAYTKVASLDFTPATKTLSYGDAPQQFAQFWRSKNPNKRQSKSLVVLVHGGCWLSAYDIQHTYALSTALAQVGFNVWSLEYRRTGDTEGGWPNTFHDIKAGIHAASTFNDGEFSLNNMQLIGHSAGGHLALLAGSKISTLKAVIGLAAITDIEAYAMGSNSCQQVTKDFMQGMPIDKPSEYQLANPSKQVWHPNTILLQGNEDKIVPVEGLEQFKKKAIVLDGVGHFDWIHPGSRAFLTLVEQLHGVLP